MSEKPPTEDELSTLDDAQLRRIAYGRGDGPHGTGGLSREAAAQEIARRTPPPAAPAPPAPNTARPLTSPHPSTDNLDALDDDVPRPFWTRARLVGAAVLAASIAVGTAIGFGIDRVADALAPDSLAIFDRPATEIEIAALNSADQFGLGFGSAAADVELRLLATLEDIDVFAQLVPADYGTPRSDVGEQVCLFALAPDANFVPPPCIPRAVFERQGIVGHLIEMDTSGTYPPAENLRSMSIAWGPRGSAEVALTAAEGSAP